MVYDLHQREPQNKFAAFGDVFHGILEHFCKKIDKAELDVYIKEQYSRLDLKQQDEMSALIKQFFNNDYFQRNKNGVEHLEYAFDLAYSDFNLRGRIDRIDDLNGKKIAIDYKTCNKPYELEELRNSMQVKIYSIAMAKLFNIEEIVIEFWHVKTEIIQCSTIHKNDVLAYENEVLALAKEIQQCENPQPKFNKYCKWCFFKNECANKRINGIYEIAKSKN
jgi:ATP-dependent helicase/DNAse subunit B